jgi:predicted phosphodiesterase
MRRLLRYLLLKPVLWAAAKFSSKPERQRIFPALDALYKSVLEKPGQKGPVIPFEYEKGKFIIFSDQHKGAKDGADDFREAEPNYLAALEYYHKNDFCFVSMGDGEELWENNLGKVKKFNQASFDAEKKFISNDHFVKIFGNHDLYWDNDPFAWWQLKQIYETKLKVYEGAVLTVNINNKPLNIFCTHGHQGDAHSDGSWFSKFFVARIWAPLQAYLRINPNTPAYDIEKKTLHNSIMYEWSSRQKDTLLITGHTHQPVFLSMTHLESLYKQFQFAQKAKNNEEIVRLQNLIREIEKNFTTVSLDYMSTQPYYFNSGCCCFADGDITGIEIDCGWIRLIKWELKDETPARKVLEEITLEKLFNQI